MAGSDSIRFKPPSRTDTFAPAGTSPELPPRPSTTPGSPGGLQGKAGDGTKAGPRPRLSLANLRMPSIPNLPLDELPLHEAQVVANVLSQQGGRIGNFGHAAGFVLESASGSGDAKTAARNAAVAVATSMVSSRVPAGSLQLLHALSGWATGRITARDATVQASGALLDVAVGMVVPQPVRLAAQVAMALAESRPRPPSE